MPDWTLPLKAAELIQPNSLKDIILSNQERERLQQRNALKDIFANSDAFDVEKGMVSPNAIKQLLQSDPQAAISLQQAQLEGSLSRDLAKSTIDQRKSQATLNEQEANVNRWSRNLKNLYFDVQKPVKEYIDDIRKNNPDISQDQINTLGAEKFKELSDRSLKSGVYNFTNEEREKLDGVKFDYNTLISNMDRFESTDPDFLKTRKEQREEDRQSEVVRHNQASEGEKEKHDREIEKTNQERLSKQDRESGWEIKEGVDPETEKSMMYRVNKNTGETLPVEGMKPKPSKSSAGGMGSRESVYTQRIIMAANQASKDLANIAQLPVEVSTGWFGGRKQGPGLFEATKEALANKMTSRDVQLYNTMATGFQRSLAGIESAGLAPSGSLSHQMDAVLLKEGDDYLTKLSKLAQIRQIIEGGLESSLENPRVSETEKAKMRDIIKIAKEAAPFTQKDIIKLSYSDNNEETLSDVMKKNKLKEESSKEKTNTIVPAVKPPMKNDSKKKLIFDPSTGGFK